MKGQADWTEQGGYIFVYIFELHVFDYLSKLHINMNKHNNRIKQLDSPEIQGR